MGEHMNQLIQKSARKDCYFLAIKRALHGRKLEEATAKRQARQQFVTFKKLVLTTFNATEITK
jgi:hypothetical protein